MKASDFELPGTRVTVGTPSDRGTLRISSDTNDIGEDVALSTEGGKKLEIKIESVDEKVDNKTGFYLGQPVWSPSREYPLHGMTPADGQLLDRKLYSDLYNLVAQGKLPSVTEKEWQADPKKRGYYSLGDGKNNFRIPDYNGKSDGSLGRVFLSGDGKGSEGTNGEIQTDAIRNIKGSIQGRTAGTMAKMFSGVSDGVLYSEGTNGEYLAKHPDTDDKPDRRNTLKIDVSRQVPTADENRPRNVTGCFFICFASKKIDDGSIDTLELASKIAKMEEELSKRIGHYVGETKWHSNRNDIPSGALPADGQLVDRGMFPDLFNKVRSGEVPVVTEAEWLADPKKRAHYTIGDGSTNFRLPDYNGKSAGSLGRIYFAGDGKLAAKLNGDIEMDAIRNIKGNIVSRALFNSRNERAKVGMTWAPLVQDPNPFYNNGIYTRDQANSMSTVYKNAVNPSVYIDADETVFDASRVVPTGEDNHPTTVSGCMIIFHSGSPTNFGELDVLKMAELVTKLQEEVGKCSGFNVGDTVWIPQRKSIGVGRIAADGQLVKRELYPDLFNEVVNGNVPVVSESDWNKYPEQRGSYTLGDGITTFRVPDYNGKSSGSLGRVFLSGDGSGSNTKHGEIQNDLIRFHTHPLQFHPTQPGLGQTYNTNNGSNFTRGLLINSPGAFSEDPVKGNELLGTTHLGGNTGRDPRNNTLGDETNPRNVTGCYVIIGAGKALNAGSVNALYLAQEVERLRSELQDVRSLGKRVGEISFSPFLSGHENHGYYVANGDKYPLNSPVGRALKALPNDFKSAWNVEETSTTISVPNLFHENGKGFFMRAGKVPGIKEEDAIRNITGGGRILQYQRSDGTEWNMTGALSSSFFKEAGVATITTNKNDQFYKEYNFSLNASRAVPTADENRPYNVTMVPVIYLGV
ncbi:hypothetical protein [Proteus mirabilis]|uniref:hypothetical protein n=1 Tax=Proteus mirabilis TaxID=584 RepID=UPI0034D3FC59